MVSFESREGGCDEADDHLQVFMLTMPAEFGRRKMMALLSDLLGASFWVSEESCY